MSSALHEQPPTLWEQGSRPSREVVSLAVAVLLTATVLDLLLSEGLGLFFDLVFVTVCVGAALRVRPHDFFDVAALPPLAMLGVVLLLAISQPGTVARPDDGVVQATVSGMAGHGIALGLGYAACLALLAVRRQVLRQVALRQSGPSQDGLSRSGPGLPPHDE
ncbi:hypothetical protein KG112_12485 [Nocardioides sp. zg-ZUI104]|uniref:DUF6542 domain-containing protein n=1 Tax=Nocardioides faecalis TaxID=2803858 RepID=UPI001BCF3960|nr:DUF6542 domain-containing protein [Nocardioides faecalis]MBS4753624.1 hypothetical protein [Nocardioides faecalis]